MRHRSRRAYTLMEVMLVMAVMVMFAAIGYPAIDSLYSGVKVDAASDAVRTAWSEAKTHAVNEGRAYRFAVVPGKGNYRVAPDGSDYWSGSAPPQADPDNPAIVLENALPKGIVFTLNDATAGPTDGDTALPEGGVSSGQWSTVATFLPDGTADDDVKITLQMDGSRPTIISLRSLTGAVTVQRGE